MSHDDAHAQWQAVCDFCDNTAEHYCKPCGIKLCSPCKDNHLSKKLYRHHETATYTSGIGQNQKTSECSSHPGKRYQLYCKLCQDPVCSTCIVERHGKHEFASIGDIYDAIKSKATSQLETLSKTIRPYLHKELEKLESEMDIVIVIADLEQKMKDSGHHIHKEVDSILAENIKKLQKMKDDKIMPILQEEIRKTKEKLGHVDQEILSYDKHLRSDDQAPLLKFMKQRDEESMDVTSTNVDIVYPLPQFKPGSVSRVNLQQQFGKLFTIDPSKPSPTGSKTSDSDKTKGGNKECKGNKGTIENKKESITTMKLIPKEVCETEFPMKYSVRGLRLRSPKEAWVHSQSKTEFDLLDRSGKVVRTVDAGCRLYDESGKCVTDDGGLAYSDYRNRCIRSLSPNGQGSILFTTEESTPLGLCRLKSGRWVVGMYGGVIKIYNTNGQVHREVKSEHVKHPCYITINKLTDDICVSDNWEKVVVFKKNWEHRFTYSGHNSKMNPCDLCSDRQGRLLITDYKYNNIHIVDQNGQFIQYLATQKDGMKYPMSIDVDDRGNAWVGNTAWHSKLYVMKYLH